MGRERSASRRAAAQDRRIPIELINWPFLQEHRREAGRVAQRPPDLTESGLLDSDRNDGVFDVLRVDRGP
jgi:hypothetical protein